MIVEEVRCPVPGKKDKTEFLRAQSDMATVGEQN